jgi:hypothetical protein
MLVERGTEYLVCRGGVGLGAEAPGEAAAIALPVTVKTTCFRENR